MRADARRNRERLLAAADALFAERGPSVALDEVAADAGVGPGTLHRHFPTKEALVAAVVVDRVHAHVEYAGARCDRPDGLTDVLRHLVLSGQDEAPLKAALAAEGFDLRTAAPEASAALQSAVATLLATGQRAGTVRGDLDVGDVMALLAGTFAAVRHAAADAAQVDRLISVLVDGLRPRARSSS